MRLASDRSHSGTWDEAALVYSLCTERDLGRVCDQLSCTQHDFTDSRRGPWFHTPEVKFAARIHCYTVSSNALNSLGNAVGTTSSVLAANRLENAVGSVQSTNPA